MKLQHKKHYNAPLINKPLYNNYWYQYILV
jgi:hypothetical protein